LKNLHDLANILRNSCESFWTIIRILLNQFYFTPQLDLIKFHIQRCLIICKNYLFWTYQYFVFLPKLCPRFVVIFWNSSPPQAWNKLGLESCGLRMLIPCKFTFLLLLLISSFWFCFSFISWHYFPNPHLSTGWLQVVNCTQPF